MAVLDSSCEVFVANTEKEIMDYNNWIEYEVTYEILHINAQFIRVIFSVFAYNGEHILINVKVQYLTAADGLEYDLEVKTITFYKEALQGYFFP